MLCAVSTFYLAYLIVTVDSKLSKACFGNLGDCTRHHLRCNNSWIFIQDTYFTTNSHCPNTGVSNCPNYNALEETGRHNFSKNDREILYDECMQKSTCDSNLTRATIDNLLLSFSLIKYRCIKGDRTSTFAGCSDSEITTHVPLGADPPQESNSAAIIIGIVVAIFVIIGAIVLSVFLLRRRAALMSKDASNTTSMPGHVNEKSQYDIITDAEVSKVKILQTDHTSAQRQSYDLVCPSYNKRRENANQGSKHNLAKGRLGFVETDYDHINGNHSKVNIDQCEADFDTTAATSAEDDYGYNHVDRQETPNVNQNDYDTTASASKDVVDMAITEDDYDHFKRERAVNVVGSPYDTAGIVGSAQNGFSQVGENDHQQDGAVNTVGSLCDVAGTVRQPRDDYCLAGRAEGGGYDLAK